MKGKLFKNTTKKELKKYVNIKMNKMKKWELVSLYMTAIHIMHNSKRDYDKRCCK